MINLYTEHQLIKNHVASTKSKKNQIKIKIIWYQFFVIGGFSLLFNKYQYQMKSLKKTIVQKKKN